MVKNTDIVLTKAINLSILDFKERQQGKHQHSTRPINLSILDFKALVRCHALIARSAINLSILDFKEAYSYFSFS